MSGKTAGDLGDALLEMGVVTGDQLSRARARAEEMGERLEASLVAIGAGEERALAEAISRRFDLPYIEVENYIVEPAVTALLPAFFARKHAVVPVYSAARKLTLAVSDPSLSEVFDDVAILTGCKVKLAVGRHSAISAALDRWYPPQRVAADLANPDVTGSSSEAAAADETGLTGSAALREAISKGASEILLQPGAARPSVRWRLDGVLRDVPERLARPLWEYRDELTSLAQLVPETGDLPQVGLFEARVDNRCYRITVRTVPGARGAAVQFIVSRLWGSLPIQLDDLGMAAPDLARLRSALQARSGLIVVSGTLRSGKTTTLYAALRSLASPSRSLFTVEDPVQDIVEGAVQLQCQPGRGLDFWCALNTAMSHRPDAILCQELRDRATAELALKASVRGSLVMTMLFAQDALAIVPRLIDMGLEAYLVAQQLLLVQGQRLVRRICESCKVPARPSDEALASLGITPELLTRLALEWDDPRQASFSRGKGCDRCFGVGTRGTELVTESVAITEELRRGIARGAEAAELWRLARAEGCWSLRESALRKAMLGLTTLDEAVVATPARGTLPAAQ